MVFNDWLLIEKFTPLLEVADPDWWLYTAQMDSAIRGYQACSGHVASHLQVWRRIVHLRKDRHNQLRKGDAATLPILPSIIPGRTRPKWHIPRRTTPQKAAINRAYVLQNCPLDRLPYTEAFDRLLATFNAECHVTWSRHQLIVVMYRMRKADELVRLMSRGATPPLPGLA